MKRVLSIVLMLVLVMSMATTFAYADSWKDKSDNGFPPGLSKKGGFPPGIAKKFFDIDHYKWAEDAIEKMVEKGVIKGIGDGLFAPKRAVTKLEAIVMALRVMGEEEEAQAYYEDIMDGERKLKLKDRLQQWSYGYVALAEEKGILDEADIIYFRLNDAATRHEVAKYLVRAMGYEDEAQDHMDEILDYKDASFIPQGSVGYVYIANEEAIITGYEDDTFRPFNNVTRAEMAVMVARISDEDIEDDVEYDIFKGEVTDMDEDYEWIEIDDDDKFDIKSSTDIIFEDDEEGSVEDIEIGDEVRIKVEEDSDDALVIEVDRALFETFDGEIEDIDDEYDWIEIEIDNKDYKYDISDDVEVFFDDDEEGSVKDLEIGDDVEIEVYDDEIISIEVDRELEVNEYNGSVATVEKDDDEYEFTIYYSNKVIDFSVDEDFEVDFDDDEGTVEDLRVGDEIEVKMDDDEVSEITVDRDMDEDIINGVVFDVYAMQDKVAIIHDSDVEIYSLDNDVKIYLNDKSSTLSSLKKDDYVGLEMDDDEVIIIKAYRY